MKLKNMLGRSKSERVPLLVMDRDLERQYYFQRLNLTSEILKWHGSQRTRFMNSSHVSSLSSRGFSGGSEGGSLKPAPVLNIL